MTDCLSCRHAFPAMDHNNQIDFSKKVCKASPPVPVFVPDGKGGAMIQAMYPMVGKGVWCAQHKEPRDESADKKARIKAFILGAVNATSIKDVDALVEEICQ